MNILVLLDGSLSVVESYARSTGFESAQIMGSIPESIIIGISTIDFAYSGDFNQRQYELTYEQTLSYPDESCIPGSDEYGNVYPTGGSDLMLEWVRDDVILAVLQNISMEMGEIAITGGLSLLTHLNNGGIAYGTHHISY